METYRNIDMFRSSEFCHRYDNKNCNFDTPLVIPAGNSKPSIGLQ